MKINSSVPEQQPSGSNTSYIRKKSAEKTKEKEPVHPHAKIPHADLDWVLTQSPTVIRLFLESWRCESFGKQWRSLKTKLQKSNLYAAMKVLEDANLFIYEPIQEKTRSGQRKVVGWKCQNSHGYYTSFWDAPLEDPGKLSTDTGKLSTDTGELSADTGELSIVTGKVSALNGKLSADSGKLQPETLATTEAAKNQPPLNQTLTTPQPPTKVVEEGSCISQETQQTPLGGAAATSGEMQEEKLPTAAEVASLGGADVLTPQSPSVEVQADVASDEPTHLGGGESSGGSDITTKLNSYVVEAVDCDRGSLGESELKTNCSQAVVEVGHADIVARICGQAAIHYYEPTKEQKEQMMELTVRQLDVVSQRFQQQMSQRLPYPTYGKTKLSFEFALGLAKRSAPV